MFSVSRVYRPAPNKSSAWPFIKKMASCDSWTINWVDVLKSSLGCFHTKVLLSPSYLMICAIDNSIHLRWHLSFPELFCRFNQFFFILPHCICIINLSSGQNKVLYMEPSSLFPCMIFHEVNKVDYALYIRQHITELRMKRNVSEYQMSLDLGQNKNYIQGISLEKHCLPCHNSSISVTISILRRCNFLIPKAASRTH